MRLKKLRPSELLEVLALLSGCALLAYFSCRGHDTASGAAPRESRTFSAERTAPERPEDTADAAARQRAVESAIGELLERVALGQVDEARRAEAQLALVALLERWSWGTPENRTSGAAVIVQQIFDRAKLGDRSEELSLRQVRAIAGVARELARELLLLAVGSSPGADGISAAMPPGHERVSWNRLGAFTYREGEPLPAEVLALAGREVGVFGFMMTLGDAERSRQFVLVESLWGCCFGSVPELNQTILVRIAEGASAEYSAAPLLVTGRFEVGEEREGGYVSSLYRIVDAKVAPLDAPAPP
jgi:hypothetical protein